MHSVVLNFRTERQTLQLLNKETSGLAEYIMRYVSPVSFEISMTNCRDSPVYVGIIIFTVLYTVLQM